MIMMFYYGEKLKVLEWMHEKEGIQCTPWRQIAPVNEQAESSVN